MTRFTLKILLAGCIISTGITFTSCKSKPKDTVNTADTTTNIAPAPVTPAPVEVSADNTLAMGAKDATKDLPGVKADVSNGEITLTGQIQRSKLAGLMMSLNSLKPKKINNQLTIK